MSKRIDIAEARAEDRREAMMETLAELRHRLSPRNIVQRGWADTKDASADLVDRAVESVREKPWVAATAAAAAGAYLAREPITDLARTMADRVAGGSVADDPLPDAAMIGDPYLPDGLRQPQRKDRTMTPTSDYDTNRPLTSEASLKDRAGDALHQARDKAGEALHSAREKASETYATAREKAVDAYDNARERAHQAKQKASDSIDENPIIALGAGLALGALVAAVLPRLGGHGDR